MTGPDEKDHCITFRCDDEVKKRANLGAGTRDMSVSEYLRTLIHEDTSHLPDTVIENADLNHDRTIAE